MDGTDTRFDPVVKDWSFMYHPVTLIVSLIFPLPLPVSFEDIDAFVVSYSTKIPSTVEMDDNVAAAVSVSVGTSTKLLTRLFLLSYVTEGISMDLPIALIRTADKMDAFDGTGILVVVNNC